MTATTRKVRLGAKARVVLPIQARQALGLRGDRLAFIIAGEDIRVVRTPAAGDYPFACFAEWTSEADHKGYGNL